MSIKTWIGKVRIIGGTRRPDSGDEIEVRIARAINGALVVDWNSGTDAFGQARWSAIEPRNLDPASLCAALVDSAKGAPAGSKDIDMGITGITGTDADGNQIIGPLKARLL